jgi:putative GTP pyrophosphokinase
LVKENYAAKGDMETSEKTALLEITKMMHENKLSAEEIEKVEKFPRAIRELLQKYNAAMRQMQLRVEVLDENLKLKLHRNIIHHIESRLKNIPSIIEKLQRYGKAQSLEATEENIMDIAGLRIICFYMRDVQTLFETLKQQDDLTIVTVKDYISNPKENGYRSLHLIVKIPVYLFETREEVPVEIQIRTIAMDFWASLEHDLKYKAIREIEGVDSYKELKECSEIIEDVEERMQVLVRALEEE